MHDKTETARAHKLFFAKTNDVCVDTEKKRAGGNAQPDVAINIMKNYEADANCVSLIPQLIEVVLCEIQHHH
jgi:hypothetical protein